MRFLNPPLPPNAKLPYVHNPNLKLLDDISGQNIVNTVVLVISSTSTNAFTIPPNVNAYWVGLAGGEADYVEAGGERYLYTNKSLRYMTSNLAWFAKLLSNNPIATNLLDENKKAEAESDKEES